jgi:hypothetical protein
MSQKENLNPTNNNNNNKMPTVVQLKQQLSNLGLSTSGRKADLVSRLADASASTSPGAAMIDLNNSKILSRNTGPKSFHAKKAEVLSGSDSSSPSPRKKRRKIAQKHAKKSHVLVHTSSFVSAGESKSSERSSKDGLTANEKKDMQDLAKLTRSQIEARFQISGKAGKEGTTFIAKGKSGKEYAIKLFKATKSSAKLSNEAMYQKMAAERGISPRVMGVNTTHKYIIMERLQETIVDLMRRRYPGEKEEKPLEEAQQDRIIEICEQLDAAGLVQNDGNPL